MKVHLNIDEEQGYLIVKQPRRIPPVGKRQEEKRTIGSTSWYSMETQEVTDSVEITTVEQEYKPTNEERKELYEKGLRKWNWKKARYEATILRRQNEPSEEHHYSGACRHTRISSGPGPCLDLIDYDM